MMFSNLDFLECPDCKCLLDLVSISKSDAQNILYGVLSCKCAKYPVVEGVLIFKKSKYLKQTMQYILQNMHKEALLSVIELGSSLWKRFLVRFLRAEFPLNNFKNKCLMFVMKLVEPIYVKRDISFENAVSVWGSWGNYVAKRISSKSFITTMHCIKSIRRDKVQKEFILDLCCGVGHFALKFDEFKTLISFIQSKVKHKKMIQEMPIPTPDDSSPEV